MKKIIRVLGIIVFIVFIAVNNNLNAATKEDILSYVNSQDVCDSNTSAIFNSYKTTFTRLLRQKELSSSDCDRILGCLRNSVGILNSKGVCKLSDINKLTSAEKSSVYGNLSTGAGIITSAPTISYSDSGDDKTENTDGTTTQSASENTTISVNTTDNTFDVYESGVLVDKLPMNLNKLTYTGPDKNILCIIILSAILFIMCLVIFILQFNKHSAKRRFIKNMLMSLMICSSFIGLGSIILGDKIQTVLDSLKLLSIQNISGENKVELNEDMTIKVYPSYGSKYASLQISRLGINMDVLFGDDASVLSNSIGHSTWSHLPTEGETIVYSGHNKEGMLAGLKNVKAGDSIIVDTTYAKCTYTVIRTNIVGDTDISELRKSSDKETLILYTCYPFADFIYGNKRFVVYSTLENVEWK